MKRILSVDDDPAMREMVSSMLEASGYQVESVGTGYRALVRAKSETYDLILMDILMPGLDGVETISHLRELRPRVPILIMTGYANDKVRGEALGRGAFAVLSKPFTLEELLCRVNGALDVTPASGDEGGGTLASCEPHGRPSHEASAYHG